MRKFIGLVRETRKKKPKNFSGFGLVFYDSKSFLKKYITDLRPSAKFSESLFFGRKDTTDFLIKISRRSHSYHDGYHFFDKNGRLTYVTQYFCPPIIPGIKPNESYGTRNLSGHYGVHIRGIIAIGIVHSNYRAFYFTKGKCHEL